MGYGDFRAISLSDRLVSSVYVLFGTIVVAFAVSTLVETYLDLDG